MRLRILLLVSALLAAVAPAGGSPLHDPSAHVGPASVHADAKAVRVAGDLPLPIRVNTTLGLPLLPDLSIDAGWDPASASSRGGVAPASGAIRAAHTTERAATPTLPLVAVGSSLLAAALGLGAWLASPAFGLFSRIEDDALATHPLRRQALDYIAANPGASVQDMRRSLGVAWGTAVYHLGRLERAGLVAVRHREGRRGHWPLGQAPAQGSLESTAEALARLVRDHPGLPQNELAQRAGILPPAACKQLRRLEAAGFVQARRAGRAKVYEPTARLDGVLAKALPA